MSTQDTQDKRINNISVPLATLMKLPTRNKVCGCIEYPNLFNDNVPEPALLVIWTDDIKDGGGIRKGLFSVADGTYMGDY